MSEDTNDAPAIVWSIAGTDSGGGAGLSADQRAADAFGVHLCPVVAAVTAQNSLAVTRVEPVSATVLDAQLRALDADLPPQAVKTGLLGGVEQVRVVAHWIDRLRRRAPVALVIDPVLAASTGTGFADAATLAAYREHLLPRATLVTPNRREAARLLDAAEAPVGGVPAQARLLQARGAEAVCITGGDALDAGGRALDWIATPEADGWLAAPRQAVAHRHGTGCTFATTAAAALASGFVAADALVLAKLATGHALRHGRPAGAGAGPVRAAPGFAVEPTLMPLLSWGERPDFADAPPAATGAPIGLYAIVDHADRVVPVLDAGVRTLQLRLKRPAGADAAWEAALGAAIRRADAACRAAGAAFFVNDHWEHAIACGAHGVHLGQEDLLALGDTGRARLRDGGLALGISSHSLWELARARALAPRYVACGPVWPTLTKVMPWLPQGLDNLAWWCTMAGAPVVAIGGILSPAQLEAAARCGADGVCAVRVLGDTPAQVVPVLQAAWQAGRAAPRAPVPALPHPSLARRPALRRAA